MLYNLLYPRVHHRSTLIVRTGEIMITLGLSIDTAVAWAKVIRENPAFCFEPLSGAGKNIFNQFHHFLAISYLPLFSSFALFFYFCFFFLSSFIHVRHFFRYAGANCPTDSYDRGLCPLKGRPG